MDTQKKKEKSFKRRNSILKEVNEDKEVKVVKEEFKRRASKRVSFAGTQSVKEFIATKEAVGEWNQTYDVPFKYDSSTSSMEITSTSIHPRPSDAHAKTKTTMDAENVDPNYSTSQFLDDVLGPSKGPSAANGQDVSLDMSITEAVVSVGKTNYKVHVSQHANPSDLTEPLQRISIDLESCTKTTEIRSHRSFHSSTRLVKDDDVTCRVPMDLNMTSIHMNGSYKDDLDDTVPVEQDEKEINDGNRTKTDKVNQDVNDSMELTNTVAQFRVGSNSGLEDLNSNEKDVSITCAVVKPQIIVTKGNSKSEDIKQTSDSVNPPSKKPFSLDEILHYSIQENEGHQTNMNIKNVSSSSSRHDKTENQVQKEIEQMDNFNDKPNIEDNLVSPFNDSLINDVFVPVDEVPNSSMEMLLTAPLAQVIHASNESKIKDKKPNDGSQETEDNGDMDITSTCVGSNKPQSRISECSPSKIPLCDKSRVSGDVNDQEVRNIPTEMHLTVPVSRIIHVSNEIKNKSVYINSSTNLVSEASHRTDYIGKSMDISNTCIGNEDGDIKGDSYISECTPVKSSSDLSVSCQKSTDNGTSDKSRMLSTSSTTNRHSETIKSSNIDTEMDVTEQNPSSEQLPSSSPLKRQNLELDEDEPAAKIQCVNDKRNNTVHMDVDQKSGHKSVIDEMEVSLLSLNSTKGDLIDAENPVNIHMEMRTESVMKVGNTSTVDRNKTIRDPHNKTSSNDVEMTRKDKDDEMVESRIGCTFCQSFIKRPPRDDDDWLEKYRPVKKVFAHSVLTVRRKRKETDHDVIDVDLLKTPFHLHLEVDFNDHPCVKSAKYIMTKRETGFMKKAIEFFGDDVNAKLQDLIGATLCSLEEKLSEVSSAVDNLMVFANDLKLVQMFHLTKLEQNRMLVEFVNVEAHLLVELNVELKLHQGSNSPLVKYIVTPKIKIGNLRKKSIEDAISLADEAKFQLNAIVKSIDHIVSSMS